MAFSYSSISKFLQCQTAYFHQYVLKDVEYQQSDAAIWGSECHDFIDSAVKGTVEFTPRFEFLRPIVDAVKAAEGQVHTEYAISFKDGWKPTDWRDKEAFLKGKSDLTIFHPTEPRVIIKDWKFCGKIEPHKYRLELDMFSLLHFKKHPEIERIDTGLVWLKTRGPESKLVYIRQQESELEDDILGKIQQIEDAIESGDFKHTQGGLCYGWCSAKNCKYWRPMKKKY